MKNTISDEIIIGFEQIKFEPSTEPEPSRALEKI